MLSPEKDRNFHYRAREKDSKMQCHHTHGNTVKVYIYVEASFLSLGHISNELTGEALWGQHAEKSQLVLNKVDKLQKESCSTNYNMDTVVHRIKQIKQINKLILIDINISQFIC